MISWNSSSTATPVILLNSEVSGRSRGQRLQGYCPSFFFIYRQQWEISNVKAFPQHQWCLSENSLKLVSTYLPPTTNLHPKQRYWKDSAQQKVSGKSIPPPFFNPMWKLFVTPCIQSLWNASAFSNARNQHSLEWKGNNSFRAWDRKYTRWAWSHLIVPESKKVPSPQITIITMMEICQRETWGHRTSRTRRWEDIQIHETTPDVQI